MMEAQKKMKMNVLIGMYEEGGFRMLDIQSPNRALKASWMKRLLNLEGTWKTYILEKLPTDIRYLTRCNINNADLPFKFKKDSIWQEVWTFHSNSRQIAHGRKYGQPGVKKTIRKQLQTQQKS